MAETVAAAARGLPVGSADWVWPWWLQRQLDPLSPAWLAAPGALDNLTGRNWTTLGVPDRPERWVVDGRGLLSPVGAGWGVDWMVSASDGWHVPARAGTVRQQRVDSAPVIETVLSVRGGAVVHRCWAELAGDRVLAYVEIRNDGPETVAVAVGLRPYSPERLGRVSAVRVTDRVVYLEGSAVLHAAVPARHGVARGGGDDAAAVVLAGKAGDPPAREASSPEGWATAALVWALGGRETLLLSVGPGGFTRRAEPAPTSGPVVVTSAGGDRVAAGWGAQARSAVRLELPEGRLSEAVHAAHRRLPLVAVGDELARPVAAERVLALVSAGWLDEAGSIIGTWTASPARGGRLGRDAADTAASLVAVHAWARAAGRALPPGAIGAVGRAAEHVARRGRRLAPGDGERRRLAAGLAAAAALLDAGGERDAADRVEGWRTGLADPAAAGGPDGSDGSVADPPGWSPGSALLVGDGYRCLDAVGAALGAIRLGRDPSGPLRWLLDVATSTWTWPGAVHPRLGTGSGGDGDDPDVTVGFWNVARELLVGGSPTGGASDGGAGSRLALARWWPPEWTGEPLEVHGLPTGAGRVGFALRWHGRRPALLWEVAGEGPEVTVSAPGLDPAWGATGRRGEALLSELPSAAPDRG